MFMKRKLFVWLTVIAMVFMLLPNAALAAPGDIHKCHRRDIIDP